MRGTWGNQKWTKIQSWWNVKGGVHRGGSEHPYDFQVCRVYSSGWSWTPKEEASQSYPGFPGGEPEGHRDEAAYPKTHRKGWAIALIIETARCMPGTAQDG